MSGMPGLQTRQKVEDFIMLMGRRAGDPGLAEALPVLGEDDHGRVYVSLRETIDTGGSLSLTIKPGDGFEKGMVRLDEMARRTLRARARMRAIGGVEDDDHHAPEWSFTIHRVMDAVLRGIGADPMWLIPMHRNTGGQRMLDLAREGTQVAMSDVKTEAGRIHVDVLQIHGKPNMLLQVAREGTVVRISGTLPESIVASLVGSKLGDVVSHPLLERAYDVGIVSARMDDTANLAIVLHLEDEQVPVKPAPEGADTSWMGMRF